MIDKIGLTGVPSSAGAHYAGLEKAPQALRRVGLVTELKNRGAEVSDFGDLPLSLYQPLSIDRKQQNLTSVITVARNVADRVDEILKSHLKPFIIGGDCTITLGVLSGYLRHTERLGLLYFDGDVDLNTPTTTQSGIFDSMGMAHILGEGAETLSHLGPRFPLLLAEHIALFGFHPLEIEKPEQAFLAQSQLLQFPVTSFSNKPTEDAHRALNQLEQRVDKILVHFDVDAIDSAECPLGNFPHHNMGLTLSSALECLSVFCSSPKCGGLVLTELNPDHDGDGSLVPAFAQLLVKALTEQS